MQLKQINSLSRCRNGFGRKQDAMYHSSLEMGETMQLTANHLDLFLKKCVTFGGPKHKIQ